MCMKATLSDRNTDVESKLVKDRAAGSTIRSQHTDADRQTLVLIAQLGLEKLAGETSPTEADLRCQELAVKN